MTDSCRLGSVVLPSTESELGKSVKGPLYMPLDPFSDSGGSQGHDTSLIVSLNQCEEKIRFKNILGKFGQFLLW